MSVVKEGKGEKSGLGAITYGVTYHEQEAPPVLPGDHHGVAALSYGVGHDECDED